jgi:hypothetical protein
VIDAYRIGARGEVRATFRGAPPRSRVASFAFATGLVVLCLAVALPHAAAGYALARSHAVLDAVFVGEATPVRVAVGVVAYSPVPRTPYEPVPDRAGPSGSRRRRRRSPRAASAAAAARDDGSADGNPWVEQGRLTVAVLGTDAGSESVGRPLGRDDGRDRRHPHR